MPLTNHSKSMPEWIVENQKAVLAYPRPLFLVKWLHSWNWSGNGITTLAINFYDSTGNANRLYEGAIDDARIYNRALSEAEILYLSNQ